MGHRKYDTRVTMKKHNMETLSEITAEDMYADIFNWLLNVVYSLFSWEGLPSTISSTWLEKIITTNGYAAVVDVPEMGLVSGACIFRGTYNIIGEPIDVRLTSFDNQAGIDMDISNMVNVIIYNNMTRTPIVPLVGSTARKLSKIMYLIMKNANQQSFPLIIPTTKDEQLSFEYAAENTNGFSGYVLVKSSLADAFSKASPVNVNVPFVCDKLMDTYSNILNNFLQMIGVDSLQVDKKERLTVGEVNVNNEVTAITNDAMLSCRLEACERINNVFGLDVSVSRNKNIYIPDMSFGYGGDGVE